MIDKDGKTVVEFGKFSKDELLNASYCNSGITVVKQNGNKNDVYYYQTAKEVKRASLKQIRRSFFLPESV
ncbi:hypothetical protein NIA73_17210 [Anaerobutyricum hallii]|nr:hypothetical protein [Anaerobutyricum hallii]